MVNIDALLNIRKVIKQRKPYFLRQDKKRKKRLKGKWRRPRGHQSKLREKRKGHLNPPSVGYRSPALARGRDCTGKVMVQVSTLSELAAATPEQLVIIAGNIGQRKKRVLVQEALKKGLHTNIKNLRAYENAVDAAMKKRKEERAARVSKKESKQKDDEQRARKKAAEKKEETPDEKEKKEQEKKEIDRILTHQA